MKLLFCRQCNATLLEPALSKSSRSVKANQWHLTSEKVERFLPLVFFKAYNDGTKLSMSRWPHVMLWRETLTFLGTKIPLRNLHTASKRLSAYCSRMADRTGLANIVALWHGAWCASRFIRGLKRTVLRLSQFAPAFWRPMFPVQKSKNRYFRRSHPEIGWEGWGALLEN